MIKKKGQIVPKRLVKSIEKSAQHLLKFGCDCEVINNNIYPITDGCVIVIPSNKYVKKSSQKRRVKGFDIKNVNFDSSKYGSLNTFIMIEAIGRH